MCQEKIFPRNLALTLQVPSVQISTFTNACICNSMWHLLAFYLNYILKKHLDGIFSLHLKFLWRCIICPWILTFDTVEITAGTYRVIYSLYDRRLLSLMYGKCVYEMNAIILRESTHAHSCCIYTDTVWHCDHYTKHFAWATGCYWLSERERIDSAGLAPR
jgi:hypothetical protein